MTDRKYPQLSLTRDTYKALEELKVELRKNSFNEVVKALIDEHNKEELAKV